MAKWIPVKERSRLYAYIINGNQAGTVVTLTLCGILAEKIGWESIFYVFGSFALLIGILWVTLIYSDPNDHPNISQAEKDFIIEGNAISKEKDRNTLWKKDTDSSLKYFLIKLIISNLILHS